MMMKILTDLHDSVLCFVAVMDSLECLMMLCFWPRADIQFTWDQ